MDMEKLLAGLFDFQRFEADPALRSVTEEVEGLYFLDELSEDALTMLNAAGDPFSPPPDPARRDGPP